MLLLQLMQGEPPAMAAEGGRIHDALGFSDVGNRKFIPRDEPQPPSAPEPTGRPPPMRVYSKEEAKAVNDFYNRQMGQRDYTQAFGLRINPAAWDAWVEGLRESENVEDQRVGPEKSDD
jgi:hypothetical protein